MREGRCQVFVSGRGSGRPWVPSGGVVGGIMAGQAGMGLGGDLAGMVVGPPVLARVVGKN